MARKKDGDNTEQTLHAGNGGDPGQTAPGAEQQPQGDPPANGGEGDADKEETAAEKFQRLAIARTSRIIDGIRTLPALANSKVYEYSPDHPDRIFNSIEQELKDARTAFARIQSEGAGRQKSFSL